MTKLVFAKEKKAVTDSLTVAETFNKRHDRVLQDLRDLDCSEEFSLHHFVESTYFNERGREFPKVIMDEQGFTLLAMGYTGTNVMEFKEQYINEFHEMRNKIQNNVHVLNEKEQLISSMKLTIQTSEKQEELQQVVNSHQMKISELETKVETQITLYHGEQRRLQKAIATKIYSYTDDSDERRYLFSQAHREIKDRFGVSSYKDVKRKDLQSAIGYIEHWVPKQIS